MENGNDGENIFTSENGLFNGYSTVNLTEYFKIQIPKRNKLA